jgi:hypothetical protein
MENEKTAVTIMWCQPGEPGTILISDKDGKKLKWVYPAQARVDMQAFEEVDEEGK